MANRKGNVTNPKGRAKGKPNKLTTDTKEFIFAFVGSKQQEVEQAWSQLEPLDKVKTWTALIKHVVPTLSSVAVTDTNGDDIVKNFLNREK